MRVLFVSESDLGTHVLGANRYADALRVAVEREPDVELDVAALPPRGRLAKAATERAPGPLRRHELDFATFRWHLVQSLRAARLVRRQLRARPADVVLVNSHSIALAMRRTMRAVPVVVSVDATVGDWWAMPAWGNTRRLAISPSRALERRSFDAAALVLAWSEWARRAIADSAPRARVVTHHLGLDLERFSPATREPRRRPRVLFVGGRFEAKGGRDLVDALGDELGPDVELDVVSPDAAVPRRPGLRVHRLGPGDALVELFQQADVLCLPSYAEGSPWTVLEGLACGTPVVAADVGAIGELLDDGRAGVLVRPGDVGGLRRALLALLDDPARRAALGASGRALCEQRYDVTQQGPRLLELLREAATRPQAGRAPRAARAARRTRA